MTKEYIKESAILKLPILSNDGESSVVYRDNDTVIKLYNQGLLSLEKLVGLDTERKILTAKTIPELPELTIPTSAIYDEKTKTFIASRNPYIEGESYNQFDITNIRELCNIHIRLEEFLKRADKKKIVLPDYVCIIR